MIPLSKHCQEVCEAYYLLTSLFGRERIDENRVNQPKAAEITSILFQNYNAMLALKVCVPPATNVQVININSRDSVGSLRVYVSDKQDHVAISRISKRLLFLPNEHGDGIWMDNDNIFSSYAIDYEKVSFYSFCAARLLLASKIGIIYTVVILHAYPLHVKIIV